jgi:CRP-like cAMP-binding protein/predicted MFS family arabinose efflux permease
VAPAEKPPGALRAALRHRDFRYLLGSLSVSTAGDWLYGTALIVFVFQETHSAGWVAAASILRLAPYVLFGAFAGVIADRLPRRAVMIAADLARAALMFVLAAVAASSLPVGWAIAIVFVSTAFGTPYSPALAATTPSLVGEKDLGAANAVMSATEHASIVFGPALAGALLAITSAELAFAINGLTFLASAALVVGVHFPAAKAAAEAPEEGLLTRLGRGLAVIVERPTVAIVVGFVVAASFIYGSELVMLVLAAERLLGMDAEGVGYLNAAVGVGGVAAAGLTGRLLQGAHPSRSLAVAIVAAGIPLALLSVLTHPAPALALMVVVGVGSVTLDVIAVTMLQRYLSEDVVGRVFGALDSLSVGGMLLGSFIAPLLVRGLGLKWALVAAGAALPTLALATVPYLRRIDTATEDTTRALAPVVEALGGLGIFEAVPRSSLEALAAALTEVQAQPGDAVVREGDAADALYVVRAGVLDVFSAGEAGIAPTKVNELSAGDYFGEIGLIENVPRTATVRAVTECTLWRIPGDRFLSAVYQAPSVSATLRDGIVGRLTRTHPSYRPALATKESP